MALSAVISSSSSFSLQLPKQLVEVALGQVEAGLGPPWQLITGNLTNPLPITQRGNMMAERGEEIDRV